MVRITCMQCGKEFFHKRKTRKFCSRQCYENFTKNNYEVRYGKETAEKLKNERKSKWLGMSLEKRWGKDKAQETKNIISLTNKQHTKEKNSFWGRKHTERTKSIISGSQKKWWAIPENREQKRIDALNQWEKQRQLGIGIGKTHYAWKGGVQTKHGVEFNEKLRKIIRDRDDHLCQNPSCYRYETIRTHDVHHIDGNGFNNDPQNLITLCRKCHMIATRQSPEYWVCFYQNLQNMRGIEIGGQGGRNDR